MTPIDQPEHDAALEALAALKAARTPTLFGLTGALSAKSIDGMARLVSAAKHAERSIAAASELHAMLMDRGTDIDLARLLTLSMLMRMTYATPAVIDGLAEEMDESIAALLPDDPADEVPPAADELTAAIWSHAFGSK